MSNQGYPWPGSPPKNDSQFGHAASSPRNSKHDSYTTTVLGIANMTATQQLNVIFMYKSNKFFVHEDLTIIDNIVITKYVIMRDE